TKKELLVNKDKKIDALEGVFGIRVVEVLSLDDFLVLFFAVRFFVLGGIVISNDDTEDDAFSVSDFEDDESEAYDYNKDDAFSVSDPEDDESEADDDTDVMWVLPYKSHASTSKVSNFKELKGKRKKNSSEVKKPTSDLKRPYSEVRITDCVLGLRLLDLVWGVPTAKRVQWGVPAAKRVQWDVQAQNRGSSYGSWHVTWKGVRQMVST
ncbi:hypothetical protein Tco_1442571, partial [Tanacetum coccineum]